MECSLAKPQSDQKSSGGTSNSQKATILPNHPPRVGYGLVGGAYGALGAGFGAGYPQVHFSIYFICNICFTFFCFLFLFIYL